MPARFLDLEGIDQAGKETQSRLLLKEFRRRRLRTITLDFPVYTTVIGREILGFLNRKRSYNRHALHMLYSLNRWESQEKIVQALESADIVMTDRYTPSNLAYGLAKGLKLEWLTELDRGLPEPDKVIVLDVPVKYSFARKREARDVHENDGLLLRRVKRNYLELAKKFGWIVVNASRSSEAVQNDILRQLA